MTARSTAVSLGPFVASVVWDPSLDVSFPSPWITDPIATDTPWTIRLGRLDTPTQHTSPPAKLPVAWHNNRASITTPFVEGVYFRADKTWDLKIIHRSVLDVDIHRKVLSALRLCCLLWLSENQGMGLHGSCGVMQGKAVGFLGQSGAGKTTVIHRFVPETTLGDDFLALCVHNDQFWVYGTPFSGREDLPAENTRAPLRALAVIFPGGHTTVRTLSPTAAVPMLAQRTFVVTDDADARQHTLQLLTQLAQRIPVYEMSVSLTESPWNLPELSDG